MHTKQDGSLATRFSAAELTATSSAVLSPGYIEDNFLMHLAPVSLGVFFFGNFHPNSEDRIQAQRALYKTSFLYRHFLQPGGLRVVIDEGCLTLTGKTSSSAVTLMAQALGEQIMGKIKIVDQTTRTDETGQVARADGRADAELRARLQLMLATDSLLSSEGIEVHVDNVQAKVSGKVSTPEHKKWAETLLPSVVPQVKISLQIASKKTDAHSAVKSSALIDDDSLQAFAVTRVKLIPSLSNQEIKIAAQRQSLSASCPAASVADKSLIESIVKHTYGVRAFQSGR